MAGKVNYGDKYTHRVTLRLSDNQLDFLVRISKIMDVSPSDYLRMVINSAMVGSVKKLEQLENGMVGMENENVETNRDNIV